jgi:hypothetical protein
LQYFTKRKIVKATIRSIRSIPEKHQAILALLVEHSSAHHSPAPFPAPYLCALVVRRG